MTAIISTLVGGLLALAGAFVGPFLQRKHDRWLAQRTDHQTLRQKAEELFVGLDALSHQSGRASVRTFERLKDGGLEAIPLPDLGCVRALATVYFPQLMPHLDQFQTEIKTLYEKIVPDLRKAGEALDANKIKGLGIIMVIEHQQIISKPVREIHGEMLKIAPKFEEIV